MPGSTKKLSTIDRFMTHVEKSASCWVWTAATDKDGYGRFYRDAKSPRHVAHRFAYEAMVGPIPDGLQIDHLCRNTSCVNPAHLEPVTLDENVRRAWEVRERGTPAPLRLCLPDPTSPWANARKTHCKRGHEFTPENTILIPTGRCCRTCKNMHDAARRVRLRAERELVAS